MNILPSTCQVTALPVRGELVFSRKRTVLEDKVEQRNSPGEVQPPRSKEPTAETHATGGLNKPN